MNEYEEIIRIRLSIFTNNEVDKILDEFKKEILSEFIKEIKNKFTKEMNSEIEIYNFLNNYLD